MAAPLMPTNDGGDRDDTAAAASSVVALNVQGTEPSLPALMSPSPTVTVTVSEQFSDNMTTVSKQATGHGANNVSISDRPNPSTSGWKGTRTTIPRQVHACQRCRQKKIKCDISLPACTSCAATGQPCTMVDIITGKHYERRYVAELENRVHELEALVKNRPMPPEATYAPADDMTQESPDQENTRRGALDPSSSSQFVGDSSEINFARLLIANIRSRRAAFQVPKLPKLTETLMAVRVGTVESVNTEPSELPHPVVARELITSYCFSSHIICPCILREDIAQVYDTVYGDANQEEQHSENTISPQQQPPKQRHHQHQCPPQQRQRSPTAQDLFRLNMIMAIGAVGLPGHQNHPLGYYKSAMLHFRSIPNILGLEAAQNLLLLAEFALVHDTGSSIWDIARFCMRICVLLDLHKDHPAIPPPDEKTLLVRRLVFWSCYALDRLSSSVLGRPFAISDRDVTAKLPEEYATSGDKHAIARVLGQSSADQLPHETVPFFSYIGLRRISSEISTYFYRLRRKRSSGQISLDVNTFLERMETWRQNANRFAQPGIIVFLREEWLDYAVAKERLSLARAAINLVVSGESLIPKDLRHLCLHAGLSIINTSNIMFSAGSMACNRLNFHVLFSASVSCLYCLLVECCQPLGLQVEEVNLAPDAEANDHVLTCLHLSVQILKQMASSLLDLKAYSMALEAIVFQLRGPRRQVSEVGDPVQPGSEQITPTNDGRASIEPLQTHQEVSSGDMDAAAVPSGHQNGQYGMPMAAQPLMETVTPADWQCIGTGMWQFVEPNWNSFGDMYGGDGSGIAGFGDVGWNDDFLDGMF